MREEDDLKKIARGIHEDKVVISNAVPHENMLNTFRGMRSVTLGELEEWGRNGIHLIFEFREKAVACEDGNPVFESYQLLSLDEWTFINQEIERLKEDARRRNIRKRYARKHRKNTR